MSRRVCSVPNCPTITDHTRCPKHQREAEQARGSSTQRGYGAQHQRTRADWAPLVATGHVKCWRCRQPITPTEPWHLGHDDTDRTKYRGPEHVPCNTATATRR